MLDTLTGVMFPELTASVDWLDVQDVQGVGSGLACDDGSIVALLVKVFCVGCVGGFIDDTVAELSP